MSCYLRTLLQCIVGLRNDGLDLLKFDIVNGSMVIRDGRYIFCCAAKFNGEGFADQVLCFDYIVYCIDYHAGCFDEW